CSGGEPTRSGRVRRTSCFPPAFAAYMEVGGIPRGGRRSENWLVLDNGSKTGLPVSGPPRSGLGPGSFRGPHFYTIIGKFSMTARRSRCRKLRARLGLMFGWTAPRQYHDERLLANRPIEVRHARLRLWMKQRRYRIELVGILI